MEAPVTHSSGEAGLFLDVAVRQASVVLTAN